MARPAGDKLGPYEILSLLGAGGMGEVYKARDTRLDRLVAVKILPEHIAKRADLRARFEREARTVASLNHPHICVVHDIGGQDGATYLVMEYLEGETLAGRLEKGAIPQEQALAFAAQIADALDRAHRAGVTHRDVKPQNIMLTRDGAKVLDFGLAKSTDTAGTAATTLTKALTTEGMVMGTPQYMAPELFEGKEADARADIWAFGAVLYEVLTGRRAFQGKNYASLVGAILAAEPPPFAGKPSTAGWLERLVKRCLQKDPEDRYQSMRDVVLDLRAPETDASPAVLRPHRPSRQAWAFAAVACLVGAVAGWTVRNQKSAEPVLPAIFEINPPEGGQFPPPPRGAAISPDGRRLVFPVITAKGETLLHVRLLESVETRPLPGTENAALPFWSPDSKSLAFLAGGKLKRIDMSGGSPITLTDSANGRGGDWNQEGVILFATQAGLQRIPALGGASTPVTKLNPDEGGHANPHFLPGGRQFLYQVLHVDPTKAGIFAGSLDGKPATKILPSSYNASYNFASGQLLYVQEDGVLMARRLELDPPKLTGDPAVVAEVYAYPYASFADFSVSANGSLFYGRRTAGGKDRFAWRDRTGKLLETIGEPFLAANSTFEISPDESKVAYGASSDGTVWDTWILDLAHGRSSRFTFNGVVGPRWTRDGQYVCVVNNRGLYRKAADGSGQEELILQTTQVARTGGVTPDGRYLLYEIGRDIWKLPLRGERKPEPYLETKYSERWPTVSPDGRWIAYESDESGRPEIYVQGFPAPQGKWLISVGGGRLPVWRADGKELYWSAPNEILMAASIDLQAATVRSGKPETLFQIPGLGFQPSRNGRRFLVRQPEVGTQASAPLVVQLNWAARQPK